MNEKSFEPQHLSVIQLHKFLLGSIAPRPIALVSTINPEGQPNLAPFSFFNVFGVNPPTLIFSPSRRGRDSTTKHTFENLKRVPEAVINVVTEKLIHQANLASAEYPEGVSEFPKAGFTPVNSVKVKPPRVKESPVNFECVVQQIIETGHGPVSGNLVICQIVMIHCDQDILDKDGIPDPRKIKLVGRHGGEYWVKAFGSSLIEVKKPSEPPGIGIDALPEPIRFSPVLTGNELGQLGNLPQLPSQDEITRIKDHPLIAILFNELAGKPDILSEELHLLASDWIKKGMVKEALAALMLSVDL